tara:strand:+ start:271 stop:957 length:687 start_codon:yes stop_codon:yes gene_type:complete
MAKIKLTAFLADIRGKVAGTVFSKNRGGAYARTKVSPINAQTTRQSAVRSQLTSWAQAFRSLSASQIASWNSAVSNFTSTDVFGDVKTPSGINLYVKLNMNLDQIGASNISTPPLPSAVASISTLTLTANGTSPALSLAYTPSPVPADTDWIVEATAPVSPGKSFVKSEYRQISVIAEAATTPANLLAAYAAKFGNPITGQKTFVRVTPVNNVTGQRGLPLVAYSIAV